MDLPFKDHNGSFATLDVASWDDFKQRIGRILECEEDGGYRPAYGRFLFRGQSCSSWHLISSFDRRNPGLSPRQAEEKYQSTMRKFREVASIYGGNSRSIFTERFEQISTIKLPDLEALAQHHGLPTQLLDWTHSLYVAAFFAFSRVVSCTTGMVSIWVLDRERARAQFKENHLQFVEGLYRENVRQLWQMGVFTSNQTPSKHLEDLFKRDSNYYGPTSAADRPMLLRIDLPSSDAPRVIDDLNMMRINDLTLFPGLDGVVRWIEQGGYAIPAGEASR